MRKTPIEARVGKTAAIRAKRRRLHQSDLTSHEPGTATARQIAEAMLPLFTAADRGALRTLQVIIGCVCHPEEPVHLTTDTEIANPRDTGVSRIVVEDRTHDHSADLDVHWTPPKEPKRK